MNAFQRLLELPDDRKRDLGVVHTPREINQQPQVWREAVAGLRSRETEIRRFLEAAGITGRNESIVVLSGAGTSEFIGTALQPPLRRCLGREVWSIPTTDLVTHADALLVGGHRYVLISFARSGDSPESVATYDAVRRLHPGIHQIVITCNPTGALARRAADDPRALCIHLPPQTNDRSLAMTSSFSTMAVTGMALCYMDRLLELEEEVARAADGAERILGEHADVLAHHARGGFTRACYLGSGALYGTVRECRLKMQEMTEGRVASQYDSFLGVRHGPQVFIDDQCLVFAAVSSSPRVRRYEVDLLRELADNGQGLATLVVCGEAPAELHPLVTDVLDVGPVGHEFRILTDVVAGQVLATFTSLHLGHRPDNPGPKGTISRVVRSFTIHE